MQRPRGNEVVAVECVVKYNFAVQGNGPMLLELGRGVGVDYVKQMFGYLADNASVKLYVQDREIDTDEALEASAKVSETIQVQWNPSRAQAQVPPQSPTNPPVSIFRKDEHQLFWLVFSKGDWQPTRQYSLKHFRTIGEARIELSHNHFFHNFFIAFVGNRSVLDDSCLFSADTVAVRCLIVKFEDRVDYLPAPPKQTVGDVLRKLPSDRDWCLLSALLQGRVDPSETLENLDGHEDLSLRSNP
jgi:hypothetical protein